MAEHHVLGEGWENIASDPAAVHESLDMSEEISVYLFLARQLPVGQGLLIHEIYRSHITTHHSR
jgi:hypothetical protein